MVLARREHRNVSHEHQLLVTLVESCVQRVVGFGVQTREDLLVRARNPGRRIEQAWALRIFTDRDQQFPYGSLCPRLIETGGPFRATPVHWPHHSPTTELSSENCSQVPRRRA